MENAALAHYNRAIYISLFLHQTVWSDYPLESYFQDDLNKYKLHWGWGRNNYFLSKNSFIN